MAVDTYKRELSDTVRFIFDQIPYFEKRITEMNKVFEKFDKDGSLYKELSAKEINDMYVSTVGFYSELIHLSKSVTDLLINDEIRRREAGNSYRDLRRKRAGK